MADTRKRLELRIDPEIHALLDEEAEREHRTLNAHIAYLLERHVDGTLGRRAVVRKERRGLAVREQTAAVLQEHQP